jgi:hypothetical protein
MNKSQKSQPSITRHPLKRALIAAAALGVVASAQGAELKVTGEFGWFGVGKAIEVEKGHFYWVGEFSGTFFNDKGEGSPLHRAGVKCPAWFDADFTNNRSKAGGYCVITDLDGDQITNSWQNAGTPGPGGKGPGTFEYISGTGKYKGISGKNTFVGVTQVNWADGTSSGYATWNR